MFPSHYEGFGYPLVEAMACARPSIAYRNSSITEVVSDAGILLRPGTPLQEAMTSLLQDDALYATLCQRSLARAPIFSHAHGARSLGNLFLSMVSLQNG